MKKELNITVPLLIIISVLVLIIIILAFPNSEKEEVQQRTSNFIYYQGNGDYISTEQTVLERPTRRKAYLKINKNNPNFIEVCAYDREEYCIVHDDYWLAREEILDYFNFDSSWVQQGVVWLYPGDENIMCQVDYSPIPTIYVTFCRNDSIGLVVDSAGSVSSIDYVTNYSCQDTGSAYLSTSCGDSDQ